MAHYNEFMSRCIQRLIAVLTVLGLVGWMSPVSAQAAPGVRPALASSPYDLIDAVNELRASYGLAPYTVNATLMAVAQAHADYMAATGKSSHTGLGGSSVTERLLAAGYPLAGDLSLGGFRSENITSGSEAKTAQDAVHGWTGDTLHLTTMISPSLTEIGAGVSVSGGRVYYVIDCALPTNNGLPQPAAATLAVSISTAVPSGGVVFPVEVVTPNADGDVIHEVKAGQSLWQIAIAYETKIDEIKRLNNLVDNSLYPGNKLLIRKGAMGSPTVAAATGTMDVPLNPTGLPTMTATSMVPSETITPIAPPAITSTHSVMGAAIAILALALLGGGIFVRLGASKKTDS